MICIDIQNFAADFLLLIHIKDTGEDGLIPAWRFSGYVGKKKLEASLITNGQDVEGLTGYPCLRVHVHYSSVCVTNPGIPNG